MNEYNEEDPLDRMEAEMVRLEVENAELIEQVKLAETVIAEALEEVQSYGANPEPEDGWRIVAYTSGILATYQNGADQ